MKLRACPSKQSQQTRFHIVRDKGTESQVSGKRTTDLRHVCLPVAFHALPTLSSVERADDASAPATHVLASPVTFACVTRSPFSRQMGDALQFHSAAEVWEWNTNFPHRGTEHVQWEGDECFGVACTLLAKDAGSASGCIRSIS